MNLLEQTDWKNEAKKKMEQKLKETPFQSLATTPEFMAGWFLEEAAQAKLSLKMASLQIRSISTASDTHVRLCLNDLVDSLSAASER